MLRGSSLRTVNNQCRSGARRPVYGTRILIQAAAVIYCHSSADNYNAARSYGETFKYLLHKSSFVLLSTRLSRGPAAAEQLLNKPHLSETGGLVTALPSTNWGGGGH